ncbi:MAG: hypothetical protein APF83_12185 [Lutibacter sp. BRH_c52]|nr:MAG: hypothetical protein APF83_12185 [Lutibacter sp. BRH_c52]
MITVIIVGILAVFFAYLAQFKKTKNGLKVSFFLIFLFLAFRYDFGNDYKGYLEKFQFLNTFGLENYLIWDTSEIGWAYLNYIFIPFGFFAMVAALALLNSLIYYNFIKRYVPVKFYWLGVFIYIFDPYLMLIHASAMRQSLAISLVVLSFNYLYKKDFLRFILIILISSFFHRSALIMLILIPLIIYHWKINLRVAIIFCAIFIILFGAGSFIMASTNDFLQLFLIRYEHHLEKEIELNQGIGLGVALQFIILIITLYFARFQNREADILFKIYVISFIFIPLSLYIWLISRIGFYFTIFSIAVIPIIASGIKNKLFGKIVPLMFVGFTLFKFFQFFLSEIWIENYGVYKSIIPNLEFLKN